MRKLTENERFSATLMCYVAVLAVICYGVRNYDGKGKKQTSAQPSCALCREVGGPGDTALNDPAPITLVREKQDGRWSYFLFDADGNPKTIEYVGRHHRCAGNESHGMLVGSHHTASNLAWTIRLGKLKAAGAREIAGP